MKDVLFALANLLRAINERDGAEVHETYLNMLRQAVERAPGPRVTRFAKVLELLATDAVP